MMIFIILIVISAINFFIFYIRYEKDKADFNKGQCKRCGHNLELCSTSYKTSIRCINEENYHYKCPNCKKIVTITNKSLVNEYEFRKNNLKL